ncbi:MAG TPA: TIGR02147 family protein [Planctomycetota bacterium]|nr:TIGR02147 family protein [Planctomycetota bacterium]
MKTAARAPATPTPATCFRRFLQSDLARRCAGNPHHSLRAYAMHLGVDHSTLSQILRGKRALTATTIEKLGARLDLAPAVVDAYAARERAASLSTHDGEGERRLAADAASVVADPTHSAILELVSLAEFRADSRWIASVLGIDVDEVNVALHRLLRLGLLRMESRERWVDTTGDAIADPGALTAVVLRRLAATLERLGAGELSDHSAMTVALRADRVPEAIARIARFRAELASLFAADARRDDVYRLEIHLFPLTNLRSEPEPADGTTRDAVPDPLERP